MSERRDGSPPVPTVIGITPGDGRDLGPWLAALGALPGLILREPGRAVGEEVRAALDAGIGAVAVHLRCLRAVAVAADLGVGLHLPGGLEAPPGVRWFGASCHAWEEVDRAIAAGARYALLSPVYPPLSKPTDLRPTLGPGAFRGRSAGRVVALGGITPARAAEVLAAGAGGVAVCGALFGEPSPARAADRLALLLAACAG